MLKLTRPEGTPPEDLYATRRGLGAMFFAGYAVAGMAANAQSPAQAIRTDEAGLTTATFNIPVQGGGAPMPAYVAYPAARGRFPVIILISEVFGVHEYIRDTARRLAKQGYFVIAPAFFYRVGDPAPLTDTNAIQRIVTSATNEQVMNDIMATLFWAKQQPSADKGKIGITGFCWGGAVVWMAMQRLPDFKAGVAWYGRIKRPAPGAFLGDENRPWPIDVAGTIRAPTLGLYAGQDQGIPVADVTEMRQALVAAKKRGSDIVVYDTAQHGFHADYRASYDQAAATDGWARMLDHFAKNGLRSRPVRV